MPVPWSLLGCPALAPLPLDPAVSPTIFLSLGSCPFLWFKDILQGVCCLCCARWPQTQICSGDHCLPVRVICTTHHSAVHWLRLLCMEIHHEGINHCPRHNLSWPLHKPHIGPQHWPNMSSPPQWWFQHFKPPELRILHLNKPNMCLTYTKLAKC